MSQVVDVAVYSQITCGETEQSANDKQDRFHLFLSKLSQTHDWSCMHSKMIHQEQTRAQIKIKQGKRIQCLNSQRAIRRSHVQIPHQNRKKARTPPTEENQHEAILSRPFLSAEFSTRQKLTNAVAYALLHRSFENKICSTPLFTKVHFSHAAHMDKKEDRTTQFFV